MNEVDDAIGQAGFVHDTSESEREQGVLRRLPHAGVAAHDGGDHLPERHGGWEVAGVDDAADTEWTAVGEQLFVRGRIDGLAVQAATFGLEERQVSMASWISPPDSLSVLPISRVSSATSASLAHQESTHVADDLTTGGRRRGGPCGNAARSVEGFTNASRVEWEFTGQSAK